MVDIENQAFLSYHFGMTQKYYKNPQYQLRMPEELKAKIKEAAEASGRSMNAEICYRLEQSFSASTEPETIMLNKEEFSEYIKQALIDFSKDQKSNNKRAVLKEDKPKKSA